MKALNLRIEARPEPETGEGGKVLPMANLSTPARNRMRAELRALLNGEMLLLDVERLCAKLESCEDTVYDPVTGRTEVIPMSSVRVSALGKVMDVRLKMLGKVLPDLKAVELTGEDGQPLDLGHTSDRMVIATKLLAVLRGLRHDALDGAATPMAQYPST